MTQQLTITEKENKGLRRAYDVEVDSAVVEQQLLNELERVGKTAKLPGFRPGHVPIGILRKKYGKSVLGDVLQRTADQTSREVVSRHNLVPALSPKVQIRKYNPGGSLELSVVVEVMPVVPEIDLAGISLTRHIVKADEKALQQALDGLRQRFRECTPRKEGSAAAMGDIIAIDFKGYIDGKPFEGGEAKHYHLELGSGQFIEGFEEQLTGVKEGDARKVKVRFPQEYHARHLAGKEATFEVTVLHIDEVALPPLDDALAKKAGLPSLEELKKRLRAQIEEEYAEMSRSRLKKTLFDALEGLCSFEIPEGMAQMEFDAIWAQYNEAKKRGMLQDERPEQEARSEYDAIARRRVRLGIYLSDTARRHKIEVSQAELMQAVSREAQSMPGREQMVIEYYRENPQAMHQLKGPIIEDKAVDYLLGVVKVKEVETTLEQLTKDEEEAEITARRKEKAEPAKKAEAKKEKKEKAAGEAEAHKPEKKETAPKQSKKNAEEKEKTNKKSPAKAEKTKK